MNTIDSDGLQFGMQFRQRLRFGFQDLWKRRMTTLINLVAVTIAVVYILLPTFYGLSIYRYQRSEVERSLPTVVVASCPDVTADSMRFTAERIKLLADLPEVQLAFAKVELGVKASLDSRSLTDTTMEGTVAGDPWLSPSRLAWGRPIGKTDAREVVIPKSLFEKLGGAMRDVEPDTLTAYIQINRTVSGMPQSQTVPVKIVGILNNQSIEKIYAPLSLMLQLDQWCSSKIHNLDSESASPQLDYPHALAYVPMHQQQHVEDEAERLHIQLRLEGEFQCERSSSTNWLQVAYDNIDLSWLGAFGIVPRDVWGPSEIPPVVGVPRDESMLVYKVTDADRPDRRVSNELLHVLELTKPTFAAVVPALSMEADLAGPVQLCASVCDDPQRYREPPICGSWLTGGSRNEIVLSERKAREIVRDNPLADCLGNSIEVRFTRQIRNSAAEKVLQLPFKVVGIVPGPSEMVPLELLQQIADWSEGKVVFHESRMVFEPASAVYDRQGHVRCNLHALDTSSVASLVSRLQQMGYLTEDSLAEQEGLRRLAQALTFVVASFGLGCLIIAGKLVFLTTAMNVQAKRWEIGILKAHGLKTSEILGIFAIQGLLIGTGAFLIGTIGVTFAEPLLRHWIEVGFQIPMKTIVTESLWSMGSWWWLSLALVIALLLSTCGMVLPAAGAAIRPPVETLRRHE